MLRLPEFDYVTPATLDEALRILSDAGPGAALMAGGTDLLPAMKRGLVKPAVVVGMRRLRALRGIAQRDDGGLVIGAATTMAEVGLHPLVRRAFPVLASAAALVATPALRAMGTLGGNLLIDTRCTFYNQSELWRSAVGFCLKKDGTRCLVAPGSQRCWAVASSDLAPVMMALGARARLVGPRREREVPVAGLYRDDGVAPLAKEPDEILTEVVLPPPDGWRAAYRKVRRRGGFDFPVLGVAAAVRCDPGGTVIDARLVLGAVASRPLDAPRAAASLVGQRLTPEAISAAADLASHPARPLQNTDATAAWRKRMVRVQVARALREIVGDAGGP